ncbi:MAG: SemiSWEET transporter [Candidatus Parcubacteria bacterium]|nr:SemiSWEET transporter [Candidatus Parcubacteria bacterium]
MNWIVLIGIMAAIFTTASFVPQVVKIIKTKQTRDISLSMYAILTIGFFLWLIYGLMIKDTPIVLANIISFSLSMTVLVFKIKNG